MIDRTTPLSHRQVLVVFSGLVLSIFLAALDSTVVATALPTIVSELGGLERLAWVVTAYLLAQTIVTPLYGKLGDLYGRKGVLQSAIVIFLIGSALCGLSRDMTQLIVFRFIQGLGGGGLIVTTQAVVGDILPPRDRGRYQGLFGAVFGFASIAGPLVGGFFTTHWSWRWIFYVNLPLGVAALLVLAATLPATSRRSSHRVDYAGTLLLAVVLTGVILATDLGGSTYSWGSAPMLALAGVIVAALIAFLVVEQRAAEPVLPLQLFRNRTFATGLAVGAVVGFAMFGSLTYMPVFLQVVMGASPTSSGLQMVPMMVGMLVTSILSGQLISRHGRYKIFPVIGTIIMSGGLLLLSRMGPETGRTEAAVYMLILGLGMGMVMQVLVIAVQNAVEHRDLGVATSSATLFRFVGGSVGTAILGAIFASRLQSHLAREAPDVASGVAGTHGFNLNLLETLSPPARAAYVNAFTASISTVFTIAFAVCLIGFLLTLLVPSHTLRSSFSARAGEIGDEMGEAFAMPATAEGLED
jgi:EmrB/QacA subfamily drug resistance transporter